MDGFAWGWPLGIMGVLWAGMSEEEARRALVRGLSAGVAAWLMWALVGFGFAYACGWRNRGSRRCVGFTPWGRTPNPSGA